MPIPDFQTLMLPILKILKDKKEHSLKEILNSLIIQYKLTKDEQKEMVPSQKQTKIYNRVVWANTYMKKAGLMESPERGIFKISDEGLRVLETNPKIMNISYLRKYPNFIEFHDIKKENNEIINNIDDKNEEIQTPEENINTAYNKLRKALADELLEKIMNQSPHFFEILVVELLVKMGYGGSIEEAERAFVTGKSGDEGIDGVIHEDKLGLDIIYIQAKRWQKSNVVRRPELQKFVGALAGQGAKKGVFITTSSFTKEAIDYKPRNETKIVLIDGEKLTQLMIDYNIGVYPEVTYELKKIDIDYFNE